MLTKSTILLHYKRPEIQTAIVQSAQDREVAARFGEGFGKRPDVLSYPQDVLELAKQGASSFHVSEEIWKNPLQIDTKLKKQELEVLRVGWDLVIDIDCPIWEFSKKIAHLVVTTLKEKGISSVSCKFSGNKGFHIGVPFKAFPKSVHGTPTALLFPEGARRIALYLKDQIEPQLMDAALHDKTVAHLISKKIICMKCKKEKTTQQKAQFICKVCNATEEAIDGATYKKCSKCNIFMERVEGGNPLCYFCKGTRFSEITDISHLLEIDTVLISSRHLYRSLYSLHEKSGLASVPVAPENILAFEKEMAQPESIKEIGAFLDDTAAKEGEATELFVAAFDYKPKVEDANPFEMKEMQIPEEAIPFALFPPCMKLGLQGLKDGKKRFLFAVTNFLRGAGWGYDQIETLLKEWNTKNPQPMREGAIENHLRYHKQKLAVLPPNCDNQPYYVQVGICMPDSFCSRIRNPLQYAKLKARNQEQDRPKDRKKKKEIPISSLQMPDTQN